MTQEYRVDRTWLHQPAWNCHHDCVAVVLKEDHDAEVARLKSALGWIADPSHDLSQEDTATFFRDMALRALRP